MTDVRALVSERIGDIIATFDAHDAGILDGVYKCACGFNGSELEWSTHLGQKIGDMLIETVVELPA